MGVNGQNSKHQDVRRMLDEGAVLDAAKRGRQRALRLHKALGHPIVINENGTVVTIPPEQINFEDLGPPPFASAE